MTQIMFETFNVPHFYVSMTSVLGLYSGGKTTGLVLDSGTGVTNTVPIFEGFAIPHAIVRTEIAGKDLAEHLYAQLKARGLNFAAVGELQTVKRIKEKLCYVAEDYQYELTKDPDPVTFTLPDGNVITVGNERFTTTEALFDPSIVGLKETSGICQNLKDSISRSDTDIQPFLYNNLLLNGGTTLFEGLP